MVRKYASAVIMAAICCFSNAQAATSGGPIKGGTCWANVGYTDTFQPKTVFTCEHIGKATISEIYANGFRVVAMTQSNDHPAFFSLIIEEQR